MTLGERVRVFITEARGIAPTGGIGPQVSSFVGGTHNFPIPSPQNVHRVAPYHPPEVARGPVIFPQPGSTNSNFPPSIPPMGLPTGLPLSAISQASSMSAVALGRIPASMNPDDIRASSLAGRR